MNTQLKTYGVVFWIDSEKTKKNLFRGERGFGNFFS